ncbi:MAG TPA: FHA domain-containing protein [Myxococcales bacterium]|nr:FHA domain-containing protein [Myxococcales bacterium]
MTYRLEGAALNTHGNTQPAHGQNTGGTNQNLQLPWGRGFALSVVYHPDSKYIGRHFRLKPRSQTSLGRATSLLGEDALKDSSISRNHVTFEVGRRSGTLRDEESLNGTQVNGCSVEQADLVSGDRITLGPVSLLYHHALPEGSLHSLTGIVGVSSAIRLVVESIKHVAGHETTVLVSGESGVGKELVATALHEQSNRKGKLVQVNCGGMPDTLLYSELFGHERGAFSGAERSRRGLVEEAEGGTLFLDEIGDASPLLQTALLRFLQEGEVRPLGSNQVKRVNTRVVVATHRRLDEMVENGEFREDLYARITGWVVEVPPLRDRKEDILCLLRHFVAAENGPSEFSANFIDALLSYNWPRNVRELQNVVRSAVIQTEGRNKLRLTPALRKLLKRPPATRHLKAVARMEPKPGTEQLVAALKVHRGNIRRLSVEFGVARTTIYRWAKDAGLDLKSYRRVVRVGVPTTPFSKDDVADD